MQLILLDELIVLNVSQIPTTIFKRQYTLIIIPSTQYSTFSTTTLRTDFIMSIKKYSI